MHFLSRGSGKEGEKLIWSRIAILSILSVRRQCSLHSFRYRWHCFQIHAVGAVQISTDLSSIERRVGFAYKIEKWKQGG